MPSPSRFEIEQLAAHLHLQEHYAEQDEAEEAIVRVPWHETTLKQRKRLRKKAEELLNE